MAIAGYPRPRSNVYTMPSGTCFTAWGHFYDYRQDSICYPGRSLLIIRRGQYHPKPPSSLLNQKPDARVIMMNPGASTPDEASYKPPTVSTAADILRSLKLVATTPDDTQIQVMRLMEAKGWNEVRVFNLNDLRETSSEAFLKRLRKLPDALSIFATGREAEWHALAGPSQLPTLMAWGRDRRLLRYARRAKLHVDKSPTYFHAPSTGTHEPLYYHPMPQGGNPEEWLAAMVAAIP